MVLEKTVAKGFAKLGGGCNKFGVAFPGASVDELLFLFLGQGFLLAAAFGVFTFFLGIGLAPIVEGVFELFVDGGGFLEKGIAKLIIERGANFFVA